MRFPTISPAAYRRITLFALVALGFIVVTGAAVRLTDSGLGCPTWPNCDEGSLVPRDATSSHALIEFVNRLITGLVSLAVILAVAGSLRRVPRRADLTRWSLSLVVGVLAQIVLGGMTVLFDLAPPFVMGHYLLSAVLVACAVVLHHRAAEPDEGHRTHATGPDVRRLGRALVVAAGVVLVTGTVVTGSGPHGGDADAERLGFELANVTRIHAGAVWVLVALTLVTWWRIRRTGAPTGIEDALRTLISLEVAQGGVGYLQYFTGVPEGLVGLHVLGSIMVWGAAIRVLLHTTVVEPPSVVAAPPPVAAGV